MSVSSVTVGFDNLESCEPLFEDVGDAVIDQISNNNALVEEFLKEKEDWQGSKYIDADVEYNVTPQGGAYTVWDTIIPVEDQWVSKAYWSPARYFEPVVITADELDNTPKGTARFDYVVKKIENAGKRFRATLTTDLYTGSGTSGTGKPNFVGLAYAVATTSTNTYGNISRSSYSWWANNASAAYTLNTLNLSVINTMMTTATHLKEAPNLIITTKTIHNKLKDLVSANMQFVHQGGTGKINWGPGDFDLFGARCVYDDDCTAGYLYMLNTKYIHLKLHVNDNITWTPFLVDPRTPKLKTKMLTLYGQLICTSGRHQLVMSGLA